LYNSQVTFYLKTQGVITLKKGILACLATLLLFSAFSPILASAQSLEEIKQQEDNANQQAQQIDSALQDKLSAVNEKYAQISKLQTQIDQANAQLEEYQTQIASTQRSIDARTQVANAQLRNMQINGGQENLIDLILSSESISDFITRSVALNTLRTAQSDKVRALASDITRLDELKTKQQETTIQLAQNQATLSQQASSMEGSIEELKVKAAANQASMQEIANARSAEEQRIRDEAFAQSQKEKEQQQQNQQQNQENTNDSTQTTPSTPTPQPPTDNTGNGRLLNVQATAYSMAEPGMGFITAIGIDLRVNPWVIAVDPSVIPLGSIVEVPGYGVAIAGDTGGAIRGHIIDVHFPTVEQCIAWGRQNITIKILS
jgi:3D (Asp-Asp-Asp) domain-containing protein